MKEKTRILKIVEEKREFQSIIMGIILIALGSLGGSAFVLYADELDELPMFFYVILGINTTLVFWGGIFLMIFAPKTERIKEIKISEEI